VIHPQPGKGPVRKPGVARIGVFTGVHVETVWKIAEGVSRALLWHPEAADRDSFDFFWALS
jgi:hypothetical protein